MRHLSFLALAAAGCAAVGPDYRAPETSAPGDFSSFGETAVALIVYSVLRDLNSDDMSIGFEAHLPSAPTLICCSSAVPRTPSTPRTRSTYSNLSTTVEFGAAVPRIINGFASG